MLYISRSGGHFILVDLLSGWQTGSGWTVGEDCDGVVSGVLSSHEDHMAVPRIILLLKLSILSESLSLLCL